MAVVNLKRIAEVAGVSLATASRVLSGSDYPVKPALRQRVLDAAEELNYVPNAAAQGLLRGRTMTAGVLVGDVADPFFSDMIAGIHTAADQLGYMVTIVNTYREPGAELQAVRKLHSHQVDILILAGTGLADSAYQRSLVKHLTSFTRGGKSAVLIGRHDIPDELEVSTISIDNKHGGELMAKHLADLGHERIALLTGDQRLHSTQDRIEGFTRFYDGRLEIRPVASTRDGGYQATLELLDSQPEITAIAATADQMAFGALVALRERGRLVPGDISVSGFNDIAISKDLVPALSSIHIPLGEAGHRALVLGHAALQSGPQHDELELTLVARESTGARASA